MKLLLPSAVFLLMISVGMSLRWPELVNRWRGRSLANWLRLLVATFLLPASIALLLAHAFRLPTPQIAGLFLLGATPGAPLLTRKLSRRGFDMHVAASYQVWCAVMTPLMIPLMTFVAGKLYDRTIWIPPRVLAWQIVEKEFVPLLVGMALMHFAPAFSTRAQRAVNLVGNAVLTAILVVMLWKMSPELRGITFSMVAATVLLLISSIVVMHLVVKAEPGMVRTFAVSNANRHVGLALLLSGRYVHSQKPLPIIACYAIAVMVLMIVAPRIFKPKEAAKQAAAG